MIQGGTVIQRRAFVLTGLALIPCAPALATPPQVADIYIHVMFACILPLHAAYLVLVYRQCRLEGVNPWRRF